MTTWVRRTTAVLVSVLVASSFVAPAGGQEDETPTAVGGVFYGTELNDPDRSPYLVWVGDVVSGMVPIVWVDFGHDACLTGDDRRPVVTYGGADISTRPNGVEIISSFLHQSHCVNNEQLRFTDEELAPDFRYHPASDSLKQSIANGGPATLQRICDGSGFGGTGKNRFKSVVTGTDGRDRLVGTAARDLIEAIGGNDVVLGGSGNDIICVGEGTNTARGGKGFDILVGDSGIDMLRGGDGPDLLLGDGHNDTIEGENGNDILLGLMGSDQLFGGTGNDSLYPEIGLADGGPGPADYCLGQLLFDIFVSCEDLEEL